MCGPLGAGHLYDTEEHRIRVEIDTSSPSSRRTNRAAQLPSRRRIGTRLRATKPAISQSQSQSRPRPQAKCLALRLRRLFSRQAAQSTRCCAYVADWCDLCTEQTVRAAGPEFGHNIAPIGALLYPSGALSAPIGSSVDETNVLVTTLHPLVRLPLSSIDINSAHAAACHLENVDVPRFRVGKFG